MNNYTHLKIIFFVITYTLLIGCGGGSSDNDESVDPNTFVYVENSPYKKVLVGCLDVEQSTEPPCSLNKLPLIGMGSSSPTHADIMNRVIVSDEWMGDRLEALLNVWPEEMKLLFRGITGIYISRDIRPSYFDSLTGGIYIDPAILWLTNDEKAVIDTTQDYRDDFSKDLNFIPYGRYVNGPGIG